MSVCVSVCVRALTRARVRAYLHPRAHAHTRTRAQAHTHAHTHTHQWKTPMHLYVLDKKNVTVKMVEELHTIVPQAFEKAEWTEW